VSLATSCRTKTPTPPLGMVEGFKIKEEPITWEDKEFSTLRIRKVIPNMFMTLVKTRLKK